MVEGRVDGPARRWAPPAVSRAPKRPPRLVTAQAAPLQQLGAQLCCHGSGWGIQRQVWVKASGGVVGRGKITTSAKRGERTVQVAAEQLVKLSFSHGWQRAVAVWSPRP